MTLNEPLQAGGPPDWRTPLRLGAQMMRNRVFMPAHSYGFADTDDGHRRLIAYVDRRLRAGVALVVVGEAEVPHSKPRGPGRLGGQTASKMYRGLVAVAQSTGSLVFEQLYHPGGQVWFEEGRRALAPSSVAHQRSYLLPLQMSETEIGEVRAAFTEAARAAAACGMHGIEVKADQGKLHHQFLSRRFNRRTDAYGGSWTNRCRFLRECLEEIRVAVDATVVVGIRIPGVVSPPTGDTEGVAWADDLTLDECGAVAREMAVAGLIDYVSISGESNSTVWGYWRSHGDESVEPATFRATSRAIRSIVSVPVLLAGQISSIAEANDVLRAGDCDAVGMARALIADGELVAKTLKGTPFAEPIRPCLHCNISCVGNTWFGREIRCIYDPEVGREAESDESLPQVVGRSIAIVGGGPAGLELARCTAKAGFNVTLFEAADRLGGLLWNWAKLPGRSTIARAIDYWVESIRRNSLITVRLGSSIEDVADLLRRFDFVAIACGAASVLPEGAANGPTVSWTVVDALQAPERTWAGRDVVVVDGDRHSDPLGLAVHVARAGARVEVVCPFDEIGLGLDPVSLSSRVREIARLGIAVRRWSDAAGSPSGGVQILDHAMNHVTHRSEVTDIIWGISRMPCGLARTCQPVWPRLVRIGDAEQPRGLEQTVAESWRVARQLRLAGEGKGVQDGKG